MTVQELIDRLQDVADAGHGDVELRFAYQANYPLQDSVKGVWHVEEVGDGLTNVYIVSGGQDYNQPYGPRAAFEEAW